MKNDMKNNLIIGAVVSAIVALAAMFSASLVGAISVGGTSRAPNVDMEVRSLSTSATLSATGTTTLTQSVDGLVVGGTISTAATGTVRTVYTNNTGPKVCDASTGYLYINNNGSFAPSLVWSLGTSTTAVSSTNLIASSTSATTTDTIIATNPSLFVLASGDVITAIFGDGQGAGNANASSTYFANWSAEAGVWCQDITI